MPVIWSWEDTHEKVHKGTLYYIMAQEYLALGDVPSAYTCFYCALEEDKVNAQHIGQNLKNKPSYLTSSLVDDPSNLLYDPVVVPLRKRLQDAIDAYKTLTGSNLSIQVADQEFLQADDFEDAKRFFVATFHEIYHLTALNSSRMVNNDYSKLKIIDTLFNLGLILDQILEQRFLATAQKREKNMANAVYHLALHLKWITPAEAKDVSQFLKLISPDVNNGTPDQIAGDFLDGLATLNGKSLDHQKACILLAYHLRNFAGHNIEGQDILVKRYPEVLERCMSAIFVAIEVL